MGEQWPYRVREQFYGADGCSAAPGDQWCCEFDSCNVTDGCSQCVAGILRGLLDEARAGSASQVTVADFDMPPESTLEVTIHRKRDGSFEVKRDAPGNTG